ncbi:MAG: hypothetical protein DRJ65_04655 [Acidobacteria bacterium]|nr:MAG: hypothetical protein DRJ65_04655 [Acidobacteriota bacterium]
MVPMERKILRGDRYSQILQSGLVRPRFLRKNELEGQWRQTLPNLARLPEPFPIFSADEESILAWGYPVYRSEGMRRLRSQLERQIGRELEYRNLKKPDPDDRRKLVRGREGITESLENAFLNAMLNDYGRSLVEVFVLWLSTDIQKLLAAVPRFLKNNSTAREDINVTVRQLASMLGGLMLKGVTQAGDQVRNLSDTPERTKSSPLFDLICRDPLLLVEESLPSSPDRLAFLLSSHSVGDVKTLLALSSKVGEKFSEILRRRPEWRGIIRHVCGSDFNPTGPDAALELSFLDLVETVGLSVDLGLEQDVIPKLQTLGLRLKGLELAATLRKGILAVDRNSEGQWEMKVGGRRAVIAASSRPYDFAAHGVVESAVFRFGLIYDLTNFTAVLEEVRRAGRSAEEKALQFMYVFQSRTEQIQVGRRLTFEKFMGDGAFFSARRAARTLAAACEIQQAYDRLRHEGFPFDKGLRIAVNAAEYRLLPMRGADAGRPTYEFFGHGIVELARLTTGKSTREVSQVAELLVHAGYDPEHVDDFLRPLIEARVKKTGQARRLYAATLDDHGELINEGIVLTVAFVEALGLELGTCALWEGESDGLRWLVLDIDPGGQNPLLVGIRLLGVARLKGLEPVELVEGLPWPEKGPPPLRRLKQTTDLVDALRRVGGLESSDADSPETRTISEDLVVVNFTETTGMPRWILGEYRSSDDVILHGLHVPLVVPPDAGPIEMWLFRSRFDLAGMYEVLRRESSGVARPMSQMREQKDFRVWFLAAPHRSP